MPKKAFPAATRNCQATSSFTNNETRNDRVPSVYDCANLEDQIHTRR